MGWRVDDPDLDFHRDFFGMRFDGHPDESRLGACVRSDVRRGDRGGVGVVCYVFLFSKMTLKVRHDQQKRHVTKITFEFVAFRATHSSRCTRVHRIIAMHLAFGKSGRQQ